MKYFILIMLFFSSLNGADILKKEKVGASITAYKIEFDSHTYILFMDAWEHAGDGWFHDPDCTKCNQKMKEKP